MNFRILRAAILVSALLLSFSTGFAENLWDLQALNADGTGSHPKVGASPTNPSNKVSIQGIALNSPSEILDTGSMWQVYVQAESPDQGGIAAWAGIFYNSTWPRYTGDIDAGDRISIEGFIADHRGKVNINERHSADPSLQFTVTKIQDDVGMPSPVEISDLSTCNYFDQTRAGGAEKYQSSWVEFKNIHILSGTWGAGEFLTIEDAGGTSFTLLLSSQGDFDSYAAPSGDFHARGIFDQEDLYSPFQDTYRLWVKTCSDIIPVTGITDWDLYDECKED